MRMPEIMRELALKKNYSVAPNAIVSISIIIFRSLFSLFTAFILCICKTKFGIFYKHNY